MIGLGQKPYTYIVYRPKINIIDYLTASPLIMCDDGVADVKSGQEAGEEWSLGAATLQIIVKTLQAQDEDQNISKPCRDSCIISFVKSNFLRKNKSRFAQLNFVFLVP